MAVFQQVQIAAFYSAFFVGDDDRLYFTRAPWRLRLLLSMCAYTSLLMLVLSHVELFLPRVPFAVHQALLYGGLLAVVNPMGSFALGLPVGHQNVVAGCTCLVAVLIVGLLVLWVWLVREYSGGGQPSGKTTTSTAAGNSMPKTHPRVWKKYRKHVVAENLGVSCPANVAPSSNRLG